MLLLAVYKVCRTQWLRVQMLLFWILGAAWLTTALLFPLYVLFKALFRADLRLLSRLNGRVNFARYLIERPQQSRSIRAVRGCRSRLCADLPHMPECPPHREAAPLVLRLTPRQ